VEDPLKGGGSAAFPLLGGRNFANREGGQVDLYPLKTREGDKRDEERKKKE